MSSPDVSVIVVNWNSQELLAQCLASVVQHTQGIDYEVIVIDSGSQDGCAEMLEKHYPHVRFIASAVNLGFAAANNRASVEALGDKLLFLNPDTELLGPVLERLSACLDGTPDAGIVGCQLLNSDRSLQSSCVQSVPTITNQVLNSELLRRLWPNAFLWGMAPLYRGGDEPRVVDAISGACLMIKRRVFRRVGGFSEDYFMYAEDIDLAYKVRSVGLSIHYVPGVSAIHHGGRSSSQAGAAFTAVMMSEAIWRYFLKTRGTFYAAGYRVAMCATACGRLAVLQASRWFLFRWPARASQMSVRKWKAVVSWSLRRDELVKRYYG